MSPRRTLGRRRRLEYGGAGCCAPPATAASAVAAASPAGTGAAPAPAPLVAGSGGWRSAMERRDA
uniref:Uncharacterized protein n=1 Tax=Arundo donax TaxID=35708 RepID=A0A0A8XWH2_ARUDO